MVIFVFPLFLLGTVTPSLVKYSVSNLDDKRKNGGNTGSIQYDRQHYWLPFVPDVCYDPCGWNIDHFSDLCGNFTCVIHRVFCDGKSREKESDCIGTYFRVLLWNMVIPIPSQFWENNLTYEGESVYNYLQVYENDERVALSTNVLFGVQSVYMKQDELTGMYYDYAMAARLCSKTSRQIRWMC